MSLLLLASAFTITLVGGSSPDSTRTPAASRTLRPGAPAAADSLVLEKSRRELMVYYHGYLVRTYFVALGRNPVGDKERLGDNRTPEGLFYIQGRNPNSRYHLSLRISYPDAAHRARAAKMGVEPGGDIMIHGLPDEQAALGPAHRDFDWTNGCIAVTDQEIEELYRVIRDGTPIQIKP
jgi:murein L,D-transpeptidase YafK